MKVLHVIPTLAASYGGPRQTVLEFCQQSRGSSIASEICATDEGGPEPAPVPCHLFTHQWSRSLHYSRPLRQWLIENVARYDLVHINGIFTHATYAAGQACRRQRVPYVVSPHGMIEPWSMAQKRPRKWVAWHGFYAPVLRDAAAVVYSTVQEQRLTEESLGLQRGVVLPAGVEADILDVPRPATPTKKLLALSRLHPKKGVDLLLRAFGELKRQGQLAGWQLVVAGDGDATYVRELKAIVPGGDVLWPGWLGGAEKKAALAGADLFVLSSHQENFGRGVVEAMGCGTPVLLSPQVGLAPEIAAANAGWVVSLERAELVAGLLAATSSAPELARRGAAARALVAREFVWPRVIEKTVTLYERVAGKGAREFAAI